MVEYILGDIDQTFYTIDQVVFTLMLIDKLGEVKYPAYCPIETQLRTNVP